MHEKGRLEAIRDRLLGLISSMEAEKDMKSEYQQLYKVVRSLEKKIETIARGTRQTSRC